MKVMTLESIGGVSMEGGCREPHLQLNHIDGPLLIRADSTVYWLNFWERFVLFLGMTDAAKLEAKLKAAELLTAK